jgi:hypothetical protein
MGVTDVMLGQVRSVYSVPNGQADCCRGSLYAIHALDAWRSPGRDTSVRGIISKGRFVQGAQHPRAFGRGHIGRGHINPASGYRTHRSGRQVQGTHCPRDSSTKGSFVKGTHRQRNALPKGLSN